jgi:MutS domain V
MEKTIPAIVYDQQVKEWTLTEKKLLQRKNGLAWLRFLSLAASFIALWQLWQIEIVIAIAVFLALLGLFLFLVVKDLKNKDAIENARLLIQINRQEGEILKHHFSGLPDGQSLKPAKHAYANDLDIFGKASVYQYINRTTSEQGNHRLAGWLLNPADPTIIAERQEAAKELTNPISWSQQLRAYGMTNPITLIAETRINNWLHTANKFIHSLSWKITRFLIPLIALTVLALFCFNIISFSLFTLLTVIFFVIAFGITRIITPHYMHLNKIVDQLESLQNSIRWIENSSFRGELLKKVKNDLVQDDFKASGSIQQLKNILERFDYRFNPLVHVPLNVFFLWDLQQIMALEKWKSRNTRNISAWFNALAETEALLSIATLAFNHPDWNYPLISGERGLFAAEDLGHPLIPIEKRVTSSFSTRGEKQLNLITGSNMAGKSTFLRSIGVNIVLAMMGSPACSSRLEVSWMKVISSMRVNDNLEENTSTFYAELKKLKEIIEAVNRHEKVFLLLDEILRGTNSADRHTGSIALIRQLIRENASGLIATHDLELTKLSLEFPLQLHNYHFDVQVKNEELYFDYKLKDGICNSMNASLLMKKIGIDL